MQIRKEVNYITSQDCFILQIKKSDIEKKFCEFKQSDDPYYALSDSTLLTIVPKSYIYVTKKDLSNGLARCQLKITGIKPSQKVDLSSSSYENLKLVDTIESESTINYGPVSVGHGI